MDLHLDAHRRDFFHRFYLADMDNIPFKQLTNNE